MEGGREEGAGLCHRSPDGLCGVTVAGGGEVGRDGQINKRKMKRFNNDI